MDWLEIVGDIFKVLFTLLVTIMVILLCMYFLAVTADTHEKVTKIYEVIVQQDSIASETPDEINVTLDFDE